MSEKQQQVSLHQIENYRFDIRFGDGIPTLVGDEPAPLGSGQGPTPAQLLAAAVGSCLSDSLLFALRKFKQSPEPLSCTVTADIGRNAENRLRVLQMRAQLRLGVPASSLDHLDRVLQSFEAYCTVTQSVAGGIPVAVGVEDSLGQVLK